MFKKIALGMLSVLLVLSMASCAGAPTEKLGTLTLPGEETDSSASSSIGESVPLEEMKDTEVEDNLKGLCEFLEGNYAVSGDKTQMSYEVIGAADGYKYRFLYNGKTVQVEVYEYNLEDLNETAKRDLDSIKQNGNFTVLDQQVEAVLADNGKYTMVYSDDSGEEKNNIQKERVLGLFRSFKNSSAE